MILGELKTTAGWIRSKIRSHPAYKFDSVVSDEITYDVMQEAMKLANGEISSYELLGAPISKSSCYLPDKCKKMQEHIDEFTKIMKITNTNGTLTGAQC